MKHIFMGANEGKFPVKRMCRVLGVARSGYYAWRRRSPSTREQANQALMRLIQTEYRLSRQTYGSPRIQAALRRKGVTCGRHRIAHLMRQEGL